MSVYALACMITQMYATLAEVTSGIIDLTFYINCISITRSE